MVYATEPRTGTHAKLPGLNTLRFYAAIAVIIEHVSIQLSQPSVLLHNISFFFISSQQAVNLFFVLSGFLITYLLLRERQSTNTINIRNFYIRRILRILPLYYWIVFLGLVLFPILFGNAYPLTGLPVYRIILALTLLPNFASITAPMIHLWSIGVEEQFYLSWPWVTRSDRNILQVSFGIIIVKLFLTPIISGFNDPNLLTLFYSLRFECMAIGALGAYIYLRKYQYTKWIYGYWTQIIVIFAFIYITIANIPVNTYNTIWTASAYILLIMNIATNEHSLVKLNNHLLEMLGEISYGLYLYHFPILYLIFFAAHRSRLIVIWTSPVLLLMTTLISTGLIAAISYRWFETPFLRLKKHFTVNVVNTEAIKRKHGEGEYIWYQTKNWKNPL